MTSTLVVDDIEPVGLFTPGSLIEVATNEADEEDDGEEFAYETYSNEDDDEPFLSDQYGVWIVGGFIMYVW